MTVRGVRVLVVGATGEIGGVAARQLTGQGAVTALAGRDRRRLARTAEELGGRPWQPFDAYDLDGGAGLAGWAETALGGLDALVVAVGVAGFGPATDVSDASCEHLFTVNALAPMAVVRGALPVLSAGGAVVVVTGRSWTARWWAWPTTRRPRPRSPPGWASWDARRVAAGSGSPTYACRIWIPASPDARPWEPRPNWVRAPTRRTRSAVSSSRRRSRLGPTDPASTWPPFPRGVRAGGAPHGSHGA